MNHYKSANEACLRWNDFIFDEVCGPLLVVSEPDETGNLGIRNDAIVIQETRQEQLPARMVGTLHAKLVDETGMEAGQGFRSSKAKLHERGES